MSRNALIAVTIGAIIILGAIAAFLYSQTRPSANNVDSTEIAQETDAPKTGMSLSTIADVFSKGENTKCTFEAGTEEGSTEGTIYVSGDNARGDFKTTVDDETLATHMVRHDDTFYMWGDSLPTGIKMAMSIDEWTESIRDQDQEDITNFDPNAEIDFKCTSWTVDSTLFEEPSNVKFMSIEGSFGPDSAITDDKEGVNSVDQCNICNALTGDAKNVCLDQFSCQ